MGEGLQFAIPDSGLMAFEFKVKVVFIESSRTARASKDLSLLNKQTNKLIKSFKRKEKKHRA